MTSSAGPSRLLLLWVLPALLLFVIFSLLHRTLNLEHEGWRRVSIVAIGLAMVAGCGVALRRALDPISFYTGVLFFGLPMLLAVLLIIEVIRWISEGFCREPEEAAQQ